mmetsp:Transcript_10156/g.30747  ORF Transcript_10156/g.30747 Transcript_10156/m.30747 type:complete len:154 (-) Transcript_10156:737-1198(-)
MRSPDKINAAERPDSPNRVISVDLIFIMDYTAYAITDRYSKHLTANFIGSKSDIVEVLREHLEDAAKSPGGGIQRVHSDAEALLHNKDLQQVFKGIHVRKSCSPPYQHDRNGDVESEIKYLKQLIRMQLLANDSMKLLSENLQHAVLQFFSAI